ncbi:molybdenum cofactor biosynthesis protein MoaB [Bacillus sp. B1-b2]|nr:molybdenum cofactor biosynthesis protein MoaB [Bacillus sp. B1-b2]
METDKSGHLIRDLLVQNNHVVKEHVIIKDEKEQIAAEVLQGVNAEHIDVCLVNGGTGISKRDVTIEAIAPLLTKELPGFGEIFRLLSFTEDIGSSAILSRAIAGSIQTTAVFSMPGSSGAVHLAMNKLILPEITHIISELHKG